MTAAPGPLGRLVVGTRGVRERRSGAGPGDWVHQLLGDLVPAVDLSGAACAGRAPEWDVVVGREDRARAAQRLCGGCPALGRCRRVAASTPARLRRSVVLAGVVYGDHGQPLGQAPEAGTPPVAGMRSPGGSPAA